jgi:uncharacterized protein (TIGR00255 family)
VDEPVKEGESPVRSMTGFARVRKLLPEGELVVSLKSVNHRGLDLRFFAPPELDPFENAMRSLLLEKLARGHVEVRIAFARTAGPGLLALNRGLLQAYLAAFREAAAAAGVAAEPDLNLALRFPGMLAPPAEGELNPALEASLLEALGEAVDALNAFRAREGTALARELRGRAVAVREYAARMEEARARAVPLMQARLKERLAELLAGAGIEPPRLVQEAAILTERSDIAEELSRLKIHAAQLETMLARGGEVGKQADFLLQEMQRETNTILSKTTGLGEPGLEITDLALAAKAEIEKLREQALNLE